MSNATVTLVFNAAYALNYCRRALRNNSVENWQVEAEDIAQNAFLRWWRSRIGSRKELDTRTAARYACREYFRRAGRMPKHTGSVELTDYRGAIRDVRDMLPGDDGTETANTLVTVLRWLASGSKKTDIAEYLHTGKQYVSNLCAKLREMFPAEYWQNAKEPAQERRSETAIPSNNGPFSMPEPDGTCGVCSLPFAGTGASRSAREGHILKRLKQREQAARNRQERRRAEAYRQQQILNSLGEGI